MNTVSITQSIKKIGSSYYILVPSFFAKQLNITENSEVTVELKNNTLKIEKI